MPRRILFLACFEMIAAVVCVAQPFLGTLFVLLLVFTRPQDDRPNMRELHFPFVVMCCTILGTISKGLVIPRRMADLVKGLLLMLVYIAWMWICAMMNGYTPASSYLLGEFWTYVIFCGLLLLWVDSQRRLILTVGTLLLAGLYYVQVTVRDPRMTREAIGGESFDRVFFRNMVNFGNSNFLALLMLICIFLGFALIAAKVNRLTTLGVAGSLLGYFYVFLKAQSRGATIALLVAFLVFWLLQKHKLLIGGSTVAVVVIGLLFFAPATYLDRLGTIAHYQEDSSAMSRLELWHIAMGLISSHPLFGVGPSNFEQYAPNSQHNSYLQAASEIGIPGMILYVVCLINGLRLGLSARRLAKQKNMTVVFCLSGGIVACIVAFLVQGFFTGFAYREFVFTVLTLAYILRRTAKEYQPEQQAAPAPTVYATAGFRRAPAFYPGSAR
jgi:putative inorganic carbon (hco3(-)) transporter